MSTVLSMGGGMSLALGSGGDWLVLVGLGCGVAVAAQDECVTHAVWPAPMPTAQLVQVVVEMQLDGMGASELDAG